MSDPALLGDSIAANLDEHPEEWSFSTGFPLPLTNGRTGWELLLSETWAGDSLELAGIRLSGRETRKLWPAIDRYRDRLDYAARASAIEGESATRLGDAQ